MIFKLNCYIKSAVQEIESGYYPSFFQQYDINWASYNALLVSCYKKEPYEGMIENAQKSHRQLMVYLENLSPEQLVNGKSRSLKGRIITTKSLLRFEAKDEQEHAEQVESYLKDLLYRSSLNS